MAISGNLSCISGQDLRDEIAAGRLEWTSSDPGTGVLPANGLITFANYRSYVKNNSALTSSNYLITYGEAITNRVLGGGGGGPPATLHTYSISYPGAQTGASYISGGSGVGGDTAGSYSHEFWMKRVGSGTKQTVIHRVRPSDKSGWAFGPGTDDTFKLWVLTAGAVAETPTGIASTGAWEHLAVQTTIHGDAQTQTIIHNGATVANITTAIPLAGEVYLAHLPDVTELDDFNGIMDDLRIYSAYRAAATINGDRSSLTPGSGCVGQWLFESYTGTNPKAYGSSVGTPGNMNVVDASVSTDVPF